MHGRRRNDMSDPDTDDEDERKERIEQPLNTRGHDFRAENRRGRVEGYLRRMFNARAEDIEESNERFGTAINEEWPIIYGVATSGAHGWQLVSTTPDGDRVDADDPRRDPDAPTTLESGAYPEDLHWLVFENGYVHANGARWLHDEEAVECIRSYLETVTEERERTEEREAEVFEADDRLVYETDLTGSPMPQWWRFEPTGFVGTAEAAAAHAAGYDAATTDG